MSEKEDLNLLTKAEFDKLLEEDRILIERADRRAAEAPEVIRKMEGTIRTLRKVEKYLAGR